MLKDLKLGWNKINITDCVPQSVLDENGISTENVSSLKLFEDYISFYANSQYHMFNLKTKEKIPSVSLSSVAQDKITGQNLFFSYSKIGLYHPKTGVFIEKSFSGAEVTEFRGNYIYSVYKSSSMSTGYKTEIIFNEAGDDFTLQTLFTCSSSYLFYTNLCFYKFPGTSTRSPVSKYDEEKKEFVALPSCPLYGMLSTNNYNSYYNQDLTDLKSNNLVYILGATDGTTQVYNAESNSIERTINKCGYTFSSLVRGITSQICDGFLFIGTGSSYSIYDVNNINVRCNDTTPNDCSYSNFKIYAQKSQTYITTYTNKADFFYMYVVKQYVFSSSADLFIKEVISFKDDELRDFSNLTLSENADETIGGELYTALKEDVRRATDYIFDFSVKDPTNIPETIDIAQLYKGFTCDTANKYIYSNAISHSSSINSYIKFEGKANQVISLKAKVSSETNFDFGFAHVTTTTSIPVYSTTTDRFVYISGTVDWATYTYTIPADGTYYLHLCYRKDGSGSTGSDKVWFTDISVPVKIDFEDFNNAFNLLDNIIDAEAGHALIDLKENAIDATPGDALLPQQESIWAQEQSDLALDEKACEAGFINDFNLIETAYRSEASGLALKEKVYTQEVNGFDVKEKVFETLYIANLDLKEAAYQGYDSYLALKEVIKAQDSVLLPLTHKTYTESASISFNLAHRACIKAYTSLSIREDIISHPGVNFALYERINIQDVQRVYLLEHIRHPYLNMFEHVQSDGYKTQLVSSRRNMIPINRNGATK